MGRSIKNVLSATICDYYLSHNERDFMCRTDNIHLGYKLHHKHFDNRDHSQQGLCPKMIVMGLAGCIRWGVRKG